MFVYVADYSSVDDAKFYGVFSTLNLALAAVSASEEETADSIETDKHVGHNACIMSRGGSTWCETVRKFEVNAIADV